MKTQKLTLLRGLPGSGKTTYASNMKAVLIEADQFFIDQFGEYKFNPKLIKDAHAWCQLETKRNLNAGRDVVVANTFIKLWETKFYQELARTMTITFEIIELNGRYPNVHGVPPATIERMASQFEPFHAATKLEG
ncbi:AAA family ATPase [Vibrio vulnificus]|uniref:AAA family ATPase n=1 Tax=Vibrio vulnificus TaxID=672 RepID=UPI000CD306EC|nr:AAA family ATPase [Vibrio vulnificus]EGQ7683695.1 ATP-binding protein [Vibrio parahaemolyticus]EGS1997582.1 ATP-binding protein [Vibrio vulnificus]EIF3178364.1 AAA family ATPase [Vibrio vulnificus]EIJ0957691.1 AAA family ATPase [Vibrio vulnificus]EIJ0962004.1 AAA family ATPase [Vibrio vulnificus]